MSPLARHLIGLSVLVSVYASAVRHDARTHTESLPRALPGAWFHSASHPIRELFKRDLPTPGSQQWAAQYPAVWAPPIPEAVTPQRWLDALQAAEQAGQIPSITIPTQVSGQNPTYGPGDNPSGPEICSSTWQCRGPGDEWDAPDGHIGIGFDDGPSDGSAKLYQFLEQQNQPATHFMIGANILSSYDLFDQAYSNLQNDIAVHTWTHPYMTTMNNTQVVAQLGWTMQIIHDSTGGRVPRYWRPPYGDSDNRVRAIAKAVFNLTQINWNHDSADWSMATNATTLPKVEASINGWYSGPKSPGLIILEHELTNDTAGAFMDTYAGIKSNNWIPVSTVQLFDGAYQNADGDDGDVQSMDVGVNLAPSSDSASNTPATTATTATSATSVTTQAAASAIPSAGGSNNKNVDNTNGAAHVQRAGVPILFLLASAILSILQ